MDRSDYISTSGKRGRLKIVYVDDVQCSLVSVKKRLKEHYEIYPAESSIMLFKVLERIKADLILLDVNMPGIDGYKTLKSLKADERYAKIPVIFLTGNSDKDSVVQGLSLGAVDYVVKPFVTAKLIECIEAHTNPVSDKISLDKEETNKPCILVVDDVPSALKAVKFALQTRYKVYTLAKPESVINFLKENKPDLILLDNLMPEVSGFELIPQIRALPEYKDTPILILSSEGTLPQLNEAMTLGVSDFIVKPFKAAELNDKIAKHLSIYKKKHKPH